MHAIDRGAAALVVDYMSVVKGETVLITADTLTDTLVLATVFRAVRDAGAEPTIMTIAQVPFQGALADPYVPSTLGAAVSQADVWIDFTFPYLAGCHVFEQAMKDGRVRYLLGGDLGAGGIARLFGAVNMDEYYAVHEKLEQFISDSNGKNARITCPRGTDVSFNIDKSHYLKPRRALTPGTYLVPGACTVFPAMASVRGTICFTGIFHEYFAGVSDPLVIHVDGGIREVRGPTVHRVALDRALKRAGNGEYGNIIHFTCAIHPSARQTGSSFIEDSRVMGCNAVGMGLPWWIPGGGENHPDGVVSDQSMWIDGQKIINDGTIVGPSGLAAIAHRLRPDVREPINQNIRVAAGSNDRMGA